MKRTIALIIFTFFISTESSRIFAQLLKIEAIELTGVGLTANDDFGDYASFISKVRNPALFQSQLINQIDSLSTITNTGFSIDFIFSLVDKPFNEFIFGIQNGSVETELFKSLSFQSDSGFVSSDITNQSQYFTLKTGYRRIFRTDKKIKLLAGTTIQLGIPVSSKTTQTFNREFVGEAYSFFGKQSVSFGLSIPYGLRFKLFRNVQVAFISKPTFFFQRVDGTPSSSLLRGTNLSFRFNIQS